MQQKIILLAFANLIALVSYAQDFKIQIAAYTDSVPMSHFWDKGIEGVTVTRSSGNYQYFLGYFETREIAEETCAQLKERGFASPIIIDIKADAVLSEKNCGYASGFVEPTEDLDVPNPLRFVFFADGQETLDAKAQKHLDVIVADLKAKPKKQAHIMGFTDNKGDGTENMMLSERRTKAVRNYFINKGIAAVRLEASFYGESEPWYPNRDEKGKELPQNQRWNNRVMIKYFEK